MEEKNLVVLKDLDLVTKDDVKFLQTNSKEFLDRYRRRSLFRSRFEMDAFVLNDTEHPTPDSKYWQAIGEQAVHVSELIRLGFNAQKSKAEVELLQAEIEELEDDKNQAEKDYKIKQINAKIKTKQIEIDEKSYGQLECKKVAQERLKEIRNWEDIIPNLEANLKHGKEDWEKHHPERALLRTEWQMRNFDMLDDENKKNTVKFFAASVNHPDNKELVQERKEQIAEGASKYDMKKVIAPTSDPTMQKLLDHKRKNLMIIHSDNSPVDFGNLRPHPGMQVVTRTMPSVIIPEALKHAIQSGVDLVYIVEDDIVPSVGGMMELMSNKDELAVTGAVMREDGKQYPATLLVNIEGIRAIENLGGKEHNLEPIMVPEVECLYIGKDGILKGNPSIVNENGRPIGNENFEKFNGTYLHRIGTPVTEQIMSTEATMPKKDVFVDRELGTIAGAIEAEKKRSIVEGINPPIKAINDFAEERKGLKLASGSQFLQQPKVSSMKDFESKKALTDGDPIAKKYFNRKVRKIMVASPHRLQTDLNSTDFNILQMPAAVDSFLESPWGFNVSDSRNTYVQIAIDKGADWIFSVDDDTIIPRNALVQLFSHQADIIGGFYYRKYFPLESVGMFEAEDTTPYALDGSYKFGEVLHNVLVLPSGCTLIKVDLFKRMEPPWYKTFTVNQRASLTEDSYLCQRLREMDVDVMMDTSVQCLHVDKQKGTIYGHPEFIDAHTNTLNTKYSDYFAAQFE